MRSVPTLTLVVILLLPGKVLEKILGWAWIVVAVQGSNRVSMNVSVTVVVAHL